MKTANDKKKNHVEKILENTAYLPASGLRMSLAKQLMKLSASDLGNLALIVRIKMQDAVDLDRVQRLR